MKQFSKLICIVLVGAFISCGPSAEETASREKFKMDSIANVTKKLMEEKQSLISSIDEMNRKLMNFKADLEVANNEMSKIKEFHLLRTDAEREIEIKNQSLKIQSLEKQISNLQDIITQSSNNLTQIEKKLQ